MGNTETRGKNKETHYEEKDMTDEELIERYKKHRLAKRILYAPLIKMYERQAYENEQLKNTVELYKKALNRLQDVQSSMAREVTRSKWQIRDFQNTTIDMDCEIMCGICGYKNLKSTFVTKETDCIFNGGHIVRYICPECGCIFGPTKVTNQSAQQFDDDYTVHYAGFNESECTFKELFAFDMLNPNKNGIYLDYGCGCWSNTINVLRERGYNVYGYDAYVTEENNPYVISDKSELSRMRFDGIFSNDLLEHLKNPIDDLIYMKSLLQPKTGMMSHCTGCYEYKYEYTRFHLFFFTGKSLEVIEKKTGLKIVKYDREPVTNDLCYLFGQE